jgi:hypothetical protein
MSSHVHRKISRVAWLLALLVLPCLWFISKRSADQFIFNSRSVRTNALNRVSEGSVASSYCSQCDGERIETRRAKTTFTAEELYQNQLQIILVGKRLYRPPIEFKHSGPGKFEIVTAFGQKNQRQHLTRDSALK